MTAPTPVPGDAARSVLVHGSCVTRDAFALPDGPRFQLDDYYARSSLASAFADRGPDGIDTSTIPSSFQRRMVDRDVGKHFRRGLAAVRSDVIVLDLVDERYGLLVDDRAGVATRSTELLRARGLSPDLRRVVPGSAEFLVGWEEGRRRFVAEARAEGVLDRVVVHQARWAERCADGTRFDHQASAEANHLLEHMYDRLRPDLSPDQFLRVPVELMVGDPDHRWGRAPVHYVEEYYRAFLDLLADAAERRAAQPGRRPAG